MRECKVYCNECQEWILSHKIDFIDIEEDISGRDNVTFVCSE